MDALPATQDHLATALIDWIYSTPPWLTTGVFVALALGLVLIVLIPFSLIVRRDFRRAHNDVFSFTVTNIAVLYAVLLAFIAVASWENFSRASELAETEASLTGNLFRDADGIEDHVAAASMQAALRRYATLVVQQEWPAQQQGRAPAAAGPVLQDFQRLLLGLDPTRPGQTALMQEMLRGLNELYAARRSRVDAAQEHIPAVVWQVILLMGAVTVGFTFLLGVESLWAHVIASAGFAVALVLVVVLIVQLDYPFRGTLSVSADAYSSVIASMAAHP